jgi:hypothetical protein
MADADSVHKKPGILQRQVAAAERAEQMERKTVELAAFRDAGVLTEAEFEEQKVKLRWGIS